MAASNLGKVFVELALDDKVYKQNLAETLTSATATAKGIETSWRVLGQKSDAIYEQQRRSAENAYTLIKNAATSTAQDIIRAEEAKSERIKSINNQQFGQQTTAIEKLKSNWVAASAAVVTAWTLIGKAMSYAEMGAKDMRIESSFNVMAEASGVAADAMLENMQRATKGTVEKSELMQKATKLMLQGYNTEQIERLSRVAGTAAIYAGQSTAEAFDGLTDAIANRMPKALVRYGAITREQMKIVTAAIEGGADAMALQELAVTNLELKQKMLTGTQNDAIVSIQQFKVQLGETKEAIGKFIIGGAQKLYGMFQWIASGAITAASAIPKFMQWVSELSAWVNNKIGNTGMASVASRDAASWKATYESMANAAGDLANKAVNNITGQADASAKASKSEIADAQKKVDAQMALMKKYAGAKEAQTEEEKRLHAILRSKTDENIRSYEKETAAAEHSAKMKTLYGMNELNYALSVIDQKETALNRWYDSQSSAIIKYEKDVNRQQAALNSLYADYEKKWEGLENQKAETAAKVDNFRREIIKTSHDWEIIQRDKVLEEDRTQGGQRVGIAQSTWDQIYEYQQLTGEKIKKDQIEDIDLMLSEYKDTYAGGIKSALYDIQKEAMTAGKASYSLTKDFAAQSKDTLSNILFDGIKGDMKSFSDYFSKFTDSLLKAFTDMVAQMVAQKMMLSIFGGGSSGGGGGILGSILGGVSGMSNSGDSVLSDWGGWSIGANGFAMQSGRRLAFAAGGIVSGPTIFPMANGGAGLMGEAGPEAIMPLKRLSDGKLGVASTGSNITVNVPISGISDKSLVTDLKKSIEERVVEVIRRHS